MTLLAFVIGAVGFDAFAVGSHLITGDASPTDPWLWLALVSTVVLVALMRLRFLNEDAGPGLSRTGITTQADGARHESR